MNGAQLLTRFFESPSSKRAGWDFTALYLAIVEIEQHVDLWEKTGADVSAFRSSLPAWKRQLHEDTSDRFSTHDNGLHRSLDSGHIGVLKWAASKLSDSSPVIDENRRQSVVELVDHVRQTVVSDTSLPDELRLHLVNLLQQVANAVEHWEITGDFTLADALDRLFGAMRVAETMSSNAKAWSDLWDDWGKPIAVGLIVNAAPVGLQISQMLAVAGAALPS
jgi:hypothetical protein